MSSSASASGWALRLHAACDWLFWVMTVNVLWYLFTLAGGIVLGAAPASIAAAELTRRRLRGEAFPAFRSFAAAWRREFWRSNAVLGPVILVTVVLAMNLISYLQTGALTDAPGILTGIALVVAISILAVVMPMYAHYDLPLRAYLLTATRWMIRNIAYVILLLLAVVVVVTASLILPGLIPFVSLGAWLTIDTALCMAFFAANDKQVAESTLAPPTPTERTKEFTS